MAMHSHGLAPALLAAAMLATACMPGHAQQATMRLDASGLAESGQHRDRDRGDDDRGSDRPDVRRDAYGRPIYFRFIPMDGSQVRNGPPYGESLDRRRLDRPRTWRNDDDQDCDGGDCRLRFRTTRDDRSDRWRAGDD